MSSYPKTVCHTDSRTWVHILASPQVRSQPLCISVPTGPSSKHLLQRTSLLLFNFPFIWCHFIFYEPIWNTTYKIELLVNTFIEAPSGCFPESSLWTLLIWHCVTFVSPALMFGSCYGAYIYDPEVWSEGSSQPWDNDRALWSRTTSDSNPRFTG